MKLTPRLGLFRKPPQTRVVQFGDECVVLLIRLVCVKRYLQGQLKHRVVLEKPLSKSSALRLSKARAERSLCDSNQSASEETQVCHEASLFVEVEEPLHTKPHSRLYWSGIRG